MRKTNGNIPSLCTKEAGKEHYRWCVRAGDLFATRLRKTSASQNRCRARRFFSSFFRKQEREKKAVLTQQRPVPRAGWSRIPFWKMSLPIILSIRFSRTLVRQQSYVRQNIREPLHSAKVNDQRSCTPEYRQPTEEQCNSKWRTATCLDEGSATQRSRRKLHAQASGANVHITDAGRAATSICGTFVTLI